MKNKIAAKTSDDLRQAFDNGTILDASKKELEQYLLATGRAQILKEENRARNVEMGETLRQLLAARQSQELHSHAIRISKIALIIAGIALLVAVAQLIVGLLSVRPETKPVNLKPPQQQSEKVLSK